VCAKGWRDNSDQLGDWLGAGADSENLMTDADVARFTASERVAEAVRRSVSHLPANAKGVVEAMLEPQNVAIVAGTLTAWAGSHFFGIGEVVDVALLTVGLAGLASPCSRAPLPSVTSQP
jgi:hypothetical protein